MRVTRLAPCVVGAAIILLIALATLASAHPLATGGGGASSACSYETYNGGRFVGRQTLRFVLIKKVSCDKAHRLIGALYRNVKNGSCEGNRCITGLRGWTCSFFVATESEETGGALGGCIRTSTGAKFRVYKILGGEGFLSPDKKIWCNASNLGSDSEVFCAVAANPQHSASLKHNGEVSICNEPPETHTIPESGFCFQNWAPRAPVLPYGQQAEASGFRCASKPDGITCITVSGKAAGKGFRASQNEVVEVGA